MDIEKYWHKALKDTEILRSRIQNLNAESSTRVPYVLLCESSINAGDTVVRKGEIFVDKPSLVVPPLNPQFQGFDFEKDTGVSENSVVNFLLIRGVSLPSLRYDNRTVSLDVYEGRMTECIRHYQNLLQRSENVSTGLLKGPEDAWQFSLLIFVCAQIMRNADTDIRALLKKYRDNKQ